MEALEIICITLVVIGLSIQPIYWFYELFKKK